MAVRRGAAADICPWWGQIIGVQNNCQEELSIVPPKLVIFLKWAKINGLIHMFFQLWSGNYSIIWAISRKQKAQPPGKGLQVWGELEALKRGWHRTPRAGEIDYSLSLLIILAGDFQRARQLMMHQFQAASLGQSKTQK